MQHIFATTLMSLSGEQSYGSTTPLNAIMDHAVKTVVGDLATVIQAKENAI